MKRRGKRRPSQPRRPSEAARFSAAVRRLGKAYAELAAARRAIAGLNPPGGAFSPRFHASNALLEKNRQKLLRNPDVVGVGIGRRWEKGSPRRETVITAYVRAKQSRDDLESRGGVEVPPALRAGGRKIGVDVVPFGQELKRMTAPGDSIGQLQPRSRGTLGSYAVLPGGGAVAITAMHVADRDTIAPDEPGIAMSSPSHLDDPNGAPFGTLDLGTIHGFDAARVQLAASVTPDWVIPTIGRIAGWRWLTADEFGIGVSLVGAVSGRLDGRIIVPSADFPEFDLRNAIVANIPTQEGDSGAALVDGSGFVLGFLVGRGTGMDPASRLFSPAGPVLAFLGCNIPIGENA